MSTGRTRSGLALIALAFAGLVALGVWQIERLGWKEALIARVDARVSAPAVAAPGPSAWPGVSAENSEYRHVRAAGHYLPDRPVLTKAVTERGAGYWVLSTFQARPGFTVLVNRGFVPESEGTSPPPAPAGERTITGLLRITEPGGGFLRDNDPATDRWYSRDVMAIARARKLGRVAPYFIDAATNLEPAGGPAGGLTVIRFPNNHLVYALTWFGLAAMTAFAGWRLRRERNRLHKG